MAVYYYPFESHETGDESNPYDRAITAEQERMFNKLRYVNGVFNPDGGALRVTSNSNMTVTVGTGGCHIEGAIAYNDAPITLQIEAADATLNRIDRVVAQFNTSDSVRAISILVRTGTAATNPIAPELRTEPNLYEIALADVYVGKNVSSIGTANITDQRLNSALCGQVVPAIPIPLDLTGIYDQYQASLNEWLDTVASALDETLAGNLQSQITTLNTSLNTIAPNGIVDFAHGGTNANNAADARQNLNYMGVNPIASIEEDTPTNWAALGTGVAYINSSGILNNQPTNSGFVHNVVSGGMVFQTFYSMYGNSPVWHRSGNSSGWSNWVRSLDENNGIQIKKLWTNASPTSNFAAQSIDINYTEYDAVAINAKPLKITDRYICAITKSNSAGIILSETYTDKTSGICNRSRAATFSTNSISFALAQAKVGTQYSDIADTMIPVEIYGIKGVL